MTAPKWLHRLLGCSSDPSVDILDVLGDFSVHDWEDFVNAIVTRGDGYNTILRAFDLRPDESALAVVGTGIEQLGASAQRHFRTAIDNSVRALVISPHGGEQQNRGHTDQSRLLSALRLAGMSGGAVSPACLVAILEDTTQEASVREIAASILSDSDRSYDKTIWARLPYERDLFLLPARFAYLARTDPHSTLTAIANIPKGADPIVLLAALEEALRRIIANEGLDAAARLLAQLPPMAAPVIGPMLERPEFGEVVERISRFNPVEALFPDLADIDVQTLPMPTQILERLDEPLTREAFECVCTQIGSDLASKFSDEHFPARMWSDLLHWVDKLEDDRWKSLATLLLLRAFYCYRLWRMTRDNPITRAGVSPGDGISPQIDEEITAITSALKTAAQAVQENLDCLGINVLVIATSQFPEDVFLLGMVNAAMSEAHFATADEVKKEWGQDPHTTAAELDLTNSLAGVTMDRAGIFTHPGYSVTANRAWLESNRESFPPDVEAHVDAIIKASPQLWEYQLRPHAAADKSGSDQPSGDEDPKLLAARCWLALRGGVRDMAGTEFKRIINRMEDVIRKVWDKPPKIDGKNRFHAHFDKFDTYLEDFLVGIVPVFMGGSVHTRLLQRWWRDSDKFVLLMAPRHFQSAFIKTGYGLLWPPCNYIRFLGRLKEERSEDPAPETRLSEARSAIEDLYKHAASAIGYRMERLAKGLDSEAEQFPFLQRGMNALLATERPDGKWAFVTHEADLLSLMRRDSVFIFKRSAVPSARQ